MAILAVGDVLKVTFFCRQNDQVSQNVRHFAVTAVGVGTSPTDLEAVTAVVGRVKPEYLPLLASNAEFRGASLQRIIPTKNDSVAFSSPDAGTAIGDPLPLEMAGLISFKTGIAGRRNRGRMYVPFPAEGDNNNIGHPSAAYVALLVILAAHFGSPMTFVPGGGAASYTLQAMCYPTDNVVGRFITSTLATNRWASMRTRGDYSAANVSPV